MVVDGVFEGYNSSYKVDMVAKMSFGCEAVGLVVSAKIRRVSKRVFSVKMMKLVRSALFFVDPVITSLPISLAVSPIGLVVITFLFTKSHPPRCTDFEFSN